MLLIPRYAFAFLKLIHSPQVIQELGSAHIFARRLGRFNEKFTRFALILTHKSIRKFKKYVELTIRWRKSWCFRCAVET